MNGIAIPVLESLNKVSVTLVQKNIYVKAKLRLFDKTKKLLKTDDIQTREL
jgi:hypothetical protein